MVNTDHFKGKKVAIVGFARSGLACANLLYGLGAEVSVTDNKDDAATRSNLLKTRSKEIRVELGAHSQEFIKGSDFVVVSPGVPNEASALAWAQKFKIPIISEIELAWTLCPATVIAVTGSNGKTTVTTLIGKILEAQGKSRVFVCGNIGNPFSGEVEKIEKDDFVSLEVSSFQLERIEGFKPKISIILNFSRNHLDRYNNMQEYLEAKKKIFRNQDKSDYLLLNYEDPALRELSKEAGARVVFFSETKDLNSNQAAVLAVGTILGIGRDTILSVLRDFKGIEHRLEHVAEINKVRFINDSKSTSVDSALWALKNILSPIVLITGGREKGNDYSIVTELMRQKVKQAVLIGEAKDRIREALGGFISLDEAGTLEEAVNKAFHKAVPGDCVLLSPMCKSFDMFSNYEERGNLFKKAVIALKASIES